jgi:hypothetical protein
VTRTGADAVHYARSRVGGTMPASGYCLQFVRECFDIGPLYGSAIDAWNGAPDKHPGDRNPPMAVPLFFRSPSPYDHVVFGGDLPANEIVTTFNADIRSYGGDAIAGIERDFDASYLGWTESLNGVKVWTAPAPEPPPMIWEDDDDMKLIRIIEDGRIIAVGTYQFAQVPTMEDYGALSQIYGPYQDMNIYDAQRVNDQVNRNIQDAAHSADVNASQLSWQTVAALSLAVAILVALVLGLVLTTRDGVVGGVAVLVGVVVAQLARARREST